MTLKEHKRQYDKAYYRKNFEYISERNKKYRRRTAAAKKQYDDNYRRSLRGRWKALLRVAKQRGTLVTITEDYFNRVMRNRDCVYCKGTLEMNGGSAVDRKNNKFGYIKGNIVPCCRLCNSAKGSFFSYYKTMKYIGPAIAKATGRFHCDL